MARSTTRTTASRPRQMSARNAIAEAGVSGPSRRSIHSPMVPVAKRALVSMRCCSTWNIYKLFGAHLEASQQLVELIQTGVVNDQPPPALLGRSAELHAQAELAGDVLFQILEVSGGAGRSWFFGIRSG